MRSLGARGLNSPRRLEFNSWFPGSQLRDRDRGESLLSDLSVLGCHVGLLRDPSARTAVRSPQDTTVKALSRLPGVEQVLGSASGHTRRNCYYYNSRCYCCLGCRVYLAMLLRYQAHSGDADSAVNKPEGSSRPGA